MNVNSDNLRGRSSSNSCEGAGKTLFERLLNDLSRQDVLRHITEFQITADRLVFTVAELLCASSLGFLKPLVIIKTRPPQNTTVQHRELLPIETVKQLDIFGC